MPINDDSSSPHAKGRVKDDKLDELVQQASKPKRSLADLYRTARERNLLREQPHYT